jgi:hypothetical protein
LTSTIDAPLSAKGRDLISGILTIREDWRAAMDPSEWARLRAAHLAFLETPLPSMVAAEILHAGAHSAVAHQLFIKKDGILTSAQNIPGAP